MAIARMLKVTVLAHQSVLDAVVSAMQDVGVLDIARMPADEPLQGLPPDEARIHQLEEYVADLTFVRDFLGKHRKVERPFSAFVSEKIHLAEDAYPPTAIDPAAREIYGECEDIAARTASMERERKRLVQLAADLEPWVPLHLQLERVRDTAEVVLLMGTVPAARGGIIRQALRETTPYLSVEELCCTGGRAAWVVMSHRTVAHAVYDTLVGTEFQEVSFPGLTDYPAEERSRALARIDEIDAETLELADLASELATANYERFVALVEAAGSALDTLTVRSRFAATDRTFALVGWVRASERARLEQALQPFEADADVVVSEPAEEDEPPVLLQNPWLVRPFEVLTNLYGLPRYDELDPTPLLAPFFLAFFAICVGDVGYGLMLIAGAWYIKNKIDVAPGVKQFMDLLMFGGAGAMVVGVLFGSYFALDWNMVKGALPFLDTFQVLDPLNQLPVFLIVTVALGVTQVLFGVLVAAYDLARRGDKASAFFDQFSTILMFAAIAVALVAPGATMPALVLGIGIGMVFKGRALETALNGADLPAWERATGLAWLALVLVALVSWGFALGLPLGIPLLAVTVLGLALSKAVRRLVVAILGGAYAVYGMSAFIGDILSYTRLAALGLSGALVGMVFNLLAGLVMGGAGGLFAKGGFSLVLGAIVVVLAALVFVVGHVFNVVINLLGAFVHPARLQFVEFFGKFYEGGGRAYQPFAKRVKSLVLHAGEARQEGA